MSDNRHRLPPLRFALGDYLPPPPALPLAPATFSYALPFTYYTAPPLYPTPSGFNAERRPSLCSKHAHAHRRASIAPCPSPVSPAQILPPFPQLPLKASAMVRRPSLPSLTKPYARPRALAGPALPSRSSLPAAKSPATLVVSQRNAATRSGLASDVPNEVGRALWRDKTAESAEAVRKKLGAAGLLRLLPR